jgi:hypothetical protein
MAKRRTPAEATVSRKAGSTASGTWSSTPIRHFTVTSTGATPIIAATQSATSAGRSISTAPKQPD